MKLSQIRSHRQFVLVVSSLAVFVDGFFSSLIVPLLPLYTKKFDLNQTEIGILFASFSVFNLLGSPILGPLSDRIGRRKPMLAGFFFLFCSTVLYAYATSYWLLLAARSVQGLASAATWTAGMASIADVFPPEEQGVPYSRLSTCVGLGGMIGPMIGGWLVDLTNGDMRIPFLAATSLIVLDAILRMVMIEPPQAIRTGEEGTGYGILLKDSRVVMLSLSAGVTQIISVALDTTLASFLDVTFNMSSTNIGIVYGVMALSYAVGSIISGKLSDLFPTRRYELIAIGMAITQILLSFTYRIPFLYIQLGIICVLGPAFALSSIPTLPTMNEVVERKYGGVYIGSASAILNVAWSVGSITGPIGVAYSIDKIGYYKSLTFVCGGLSLFTILFIILTIIRKDKHQGDPEKQALLYSSKKKIESAGDPEVVVDNRKNRLLMNESVIQ